MPDKQQTGTAGLTRQFILDRSIPEPNSGCWLWLGTMANSRYGGVSIGGRRMNAHRASYIAFKGHVPDDLDVDHLCRLGCCVNPDHLEAVTHRENCRRRNAIRTTCNQGHPLNRRHASGYRYCSICNTESARAYRRRVGQKLHLKDYQAADGVVAACGFFVRPASPSGATVHAEEVTCARCRKTELFSKLEGGK